MGKLIGWVLLVLGLLVLITLSLPAKSATFRGNQATCDSLSMTAFDVVSMRDAGIGWGEFQPWIKDSLDAAVPNPDSYVKDQDDVNFILGWFKRIYDSQIDPASAANAIYSDCMKKPVSVKRGIMI